MEAIMSKFNLAPAMQCSSGPTTGCHEQGKLYRMLHDGRHFESRVLCAYHRKMVTSYSGCTAEVA